MTRQASCWSCGRPTQQRATEVRDAPLARFRLPDQLAPLAAWHGWGRKTHGVGGLAWRARAELITPSARR